MGSDQDMVLPAEWAEGVRNETKACRLMRVRGTQCPQSRLKLDVSTPCAALRLKERRRARAWRGTVSSGVMIEDQGDMLELHLVEPPSSIRVRRIEAALLADVLSGQDSRVAAPALEDLLAGPKDWLIGGGDAAAAPWMANVPIWYEVAPGVEPMTLEWGPQDDPKSIRLRLNGNGKDWVDWPVRITQFAVGPWLVTLEFRSVGTGKGQQVLEVTRVAVAQRPEPCPLPVPAAIAAARSRASEAQ